MSAADAAARRDATVHPTPPCPDQAALQRRNARILAINGCLVEGGGAFANSGTVAAAFVASLASSALAVGATEAIARLGVVLPQLFIANLARARPYRKALYLRGGFVRVACLGTLAAVLTAAPHAGRGVLVTTFFVLWTGFSLCTGIVHIPFIDITGRTVPPRWQGRLLALRYFVGAVLGVGAGLLVRAVLRGADGSEVTAYGYVFGIGATVLAVATLVFVAVREPPAPTTGPRQAIGRLVREGVAVLEEDRRFRQFLLAEVFGAVTMMALPFYVLHGQRHAMMPAAEVGVLLSAQMMGRLVATPIWGWWGDHRGKLSLLRAVTPVSAIGPLAVLIVTALPGFPESVTLIVYALVFGTLGAASSGRTIAELAYLMEISPDDRRAEYSAYMNTLLVPTTVLPLVAGAAVQVVSFSAVFGVALVAAGLRMAVLLRLDRRDGSAVCGRRSMTPFPRAHP